MDREVTGRAGDDADAEVSRQHRAPVGDAGGARVDGLGNIVPVGDTEQKAFDVHVTSLSAMRRVAGYEWQPAGNALGRKPLLGPEPRVTIDCFRGGRFLHRSPSGETRVGPII